MGYTIMIQELDGYFCFFGLFQYRLKEYILYMTYAQKAILT